MACNKFSLIVASSIFFFYSPKSGWNLPFFYSHSETYWKFWELHCGGEEVLKSDLKTMFSYQFLLNVFNADISYCCIVGSLAYFVCCLFTLFAGGHSQLVPTVVCAHESYVCLPSAEAFSGSWYCPSSMMCQVSAGPVLQGVMWHPHLLPSHPKRSS